MNDQELFQQLLDESGIKVFSAKEVFFKGASNVYLKNNTDPPRNLWKRIIPTLQALQIVRNRLKVPIQLISIYRSPAYNKVIGGATNSQHSQFRACDVVSSKASPQTIYSSLLHLRRAGAFVGGLGFYRSFVHIDTRGKNATWKGK
jgi:uncharacterized protein YcbK (DUF882 family)